MKYLARKYVDLALICLLVTAGLSEVGRNTIFSAELQNLTSFQRNIEWSLRLIRDIGWFGSLSIAVIFGLYSFYILKAKPSLAYLTLGAAGYVLSILLAFYTLNSVNSVSEYWLESERKSEHSLEKAALNKSISPEVRTRITREYAKHRFIKGKSSLSFIDLDGKIVEFVPNASEIEERNNFQQTIRLIEWTTKSLKISFIVSIAGLIISFALGGILIHRSRVK